MPIPFEDAGCNSEPVNSFARSLDDAIGVRFGGDCYRTLDRDIGFVIVESQRFELLEFGAKVIFTLRGKISLDLA